MQPGEIHTVYGPKISLPIAPPINTYTIYNELNTSVKFKWCEVPRPVHSIPIGPYYYVHHSCEHHDIWLRWLHSECK